MTSQDELPVMALPDFEVRMRFCSGSVNVAQAPTFRSARMRLSTAASAARPTLSTAVASAAPDAANVGTTPCASVDLRAETVPSFYVWS